MTKKIEGKRLCPMNAQDCPDYCKGYCMLENPLEECDDYYAMTADDEKEPEIWQSA